MSDTFPLLLKEGKLYYIVSHSFPKLKLTVDRWAEARGHLLTIVNNIPTRKMVIVPITIIMLS